MYTQFCTGCNSFNSTMGYMFHFTSLLHNTSQNKVFKKQLMIAMGNVEICTPIQMERKSLL